MYLKEHSYNHQEKMFIKAVGIKEITAIIGREKIFFATIVNALQATELYGKDLENAPSILTTSTGDLEKCIKLLNNEEEYTYVLLNFYSYHKLAVSVVKTYIRGENNELNGEEKVIYEMIKLASTISTKYIDTPSSSSSLFSNDDDDDDDDITKSKKAIDKLDPITLFNRIQCIKETKYNFSDYIKQLGVVYKDEEILNYVKETTKEVDDILNNILKTEE
jgi:hypothetical protein